MVVSILDYGMGNLRSVANALASMGADHQVICDPDEILKADRLILPGVGAFGSCMATLRKADFVGALNERVIQQGVPLLGICLGMQVLASRGKEDGEHKGLGWIPGVVQKFEIDPSLKVPHMGWNEISSVPRAPWASLDDPHMYFVHSYHLVCEDPSDVIATCDYGGSFTAAVMRNNVLGTQFHPEKSGKSGHQVLADFLRWNP